MDIKEIDKNFITAFNVPVDTEWFSIREKPFQVYGIEFSEEEGVYRRLPKETADAVSAGVGALSRHTAGGRVRFETDSPYVVVRAKENFEKPFAHLTMCAKSGFSLFADNRFSGVFMPSFEDFVKADPALGGNGELIVGGIKYPFIENGKPYLANVFFPLYNSVVEVCIGLKKGSVLREAKAYKHKEPIVFYGSSITQGGCASKPGDDYVNKLSRLLDVDVINLGFSGSAKGEWEMAEYIATLNPSVFVLDYDHNAPTEEYLQKTHYPFYEIVRKAHPTLPIVVATMPTIEGYQTFPWYKERRKVILDNFAQMKKAGDENVYLVDMYGCYGALENGECGTVDDCHPNSLGFLRMTERMYPVLEKLLNKRNR